MIVLRHVLPNTAHILLVQASLAFVAAIKTEVILSFLGLGVQHGVSWGLMLAESTQEVLAGHFNNFLAASLMLFVLLLGFNLLADALQDAFDPQAGRPMSAPVLSVRELSVSLRREPAVRDTVVDGISFDLFAGEVLALVGESGCGKTKTAEALMGLVPPNVGSVRAQSPATRRTRPAGICRSPRCAASAAATYRWFSRSR